MGSNIIVAKDAEKVGHGWSIAEAWAAEMNFNDNPFY